jgi:hypothetical protein
VGQADFSWIKQWCAGRQVPICPTVLTVGSWVVGVCIRVRLSLLFTSATWQGCAGAPTVKTVGQTGFARVYSGAPLLTSHSSHCSTSTMGESLRHSPQGEKVQRQSIKSVSMWNNNPTPIIW